MCAFDNKYKGICFSKHHWAGTFFYVQYMKLIYRMGRIFTVSYSLPWRNDLHYPAYTFAEALPKHYRFHHSNTCAQTICKPFAQQKTKSVHIVSTYVTNFDFPHTFSSLSISAYSSSFLRSSSSLACMDAYRLYAYPNRLIPTSTFRAIRLQELNKMVNKG